MGQTDPVEKYTLADHSPSAFAEVVAQGLGKNPKSLPCKYFYDDAGSMLFKEIMHLDEYYLTRCELEILGTHRQDIADLIGNTPFNLIELGAGDGMKTKVLLGYFLEKGLNFRYVPIDISGWALQNLVSDIKTCYGDLSCQALIADYFAGMRWITARDERRNIVLFLGSTIGNFDPDETGEFLSGLRNSVRDGDLVLIGFDLKKDTQTMISAYNDSRGVTELFNKNVLRRINTELKGNFIIDNFQYYSTYNAGCGAVESFLISRHKQAITVEACRQTFFLDQWESIHTESSYKFHENYLIRLAEENGFEVAAHFYDTRRFFIDALWRVIK
jgi:L-histidine Nalpha-methyltransferase